MLLPITQEMIKTNLVKRAIAGQLQAEKWLQAGLVIGLTLQLLLVWHKYSTVLEAETRFSDARLRATELEAKSALLRNNDNLQELAGRVAARNNWLTDKKSSPITRLASLQQDCPVGVALLSFDADLNGGKILLNAPDLNTVSGWLNRHFGGLGSLSVAGRDNNLLTIQFTWSG